MASDGKKEVKPIVGDRAIYKLNSTFTVSIPIAWFRAHDIDPNKLDSLLLVANHDIRIVNPDHRQEVYDKVTKIARDIR